jgi:hypothetical protein
MNYGKDCLDMGEKMNLIQKLHYAKKRILRNWKMGAFTILIIAFAMLLLYSSMILFEGLEYGEKAVKNSISTPISSCGIIEFQNDFDWDKLNIFIDEIYDMDEIKAIGNYECYGINGLTTDGDIDYWNRMLEIQNSHELEFEDDGSYMQMVMMNSELFEMENLHLIDSENRSADESGRYQIFLGYNFREVPVGTVFKDNENNREYEVVGVMDKGSYVTDPHLISRNYGGLTLGYKVNMDNMILALIPEGKTILGLVNTFCVNEGYSFEDAQQAIETWGEERGVKIRIGTWRGRLDTVFSSNQKIKNLIDTIAFIICISICMLCITVQLLNIYMKRNELGIWLANGMTRMDVLEILWMENFIKVAIGGIIAVVIEKLLLQLLFSDSKSTFREIVSMMYGNPLLGLVLFAILLVCIISAIPIGIIARKSTTELVKGVWN